MPDIEQVVQDIQFRRSQATSDVPSFPPRSEVERLLELLATLEHDYHATSGRAPQAYFIGGRWWNYLMAAHCGSTFSFRGRPVHHVELPGLQTLVGVAE
jgi:hypothetical protein